MTTEQRKQTAFDLVVKYGFCNDCKWMLDDSHCHECDCYQNGVKVIREAMFNEELKEKWIKHTQYTWEMEIKYECPKCHKEVDFQTKYCPYCGKKMKGE